jgi:hypothetical protein
MTPALAKANAIIKSVRINDGVGLAFSSTSVEQTIRVATTALCSAVCVRYIPKRCGKM